MLFYSFVSGGYPCEITAGWSESFLWLFSVKACGAEAVTELWLHPAVQ